MDDVHKNFSLRKDNYKEVALVVDKNVKLERRFGVDFHEIPQFMAEQVII